MRSAASVGAVLSPKGFGMCAATVPEPACYGSVFAAGRREADVYKWIVSEQAGYDRGEDAIREWVRHHWNGFLRARWIEHLYGGRFWYELDQHDHGLLQREFQGSVLIRPIVDLVLLGHENLTIILLAIGKRWPMDEVLEILRALNMNSRRLEFQVESRLARSEAS